MSEDYGKNFKMGKINLKKGKESSVRCSRIVGSKQQCSNER